MKIQLALLVALFTMPAAFATSVINLDIGRERALPECGGSVEANISRDGNQVNLVLRNVRDCSNFIIEKTGREYKIPGQNGDRTGSFTIHESDIDFGRSVLVFTVRSNSGAHADQVRVPVQRRVIPQPQPQFGACSADLCVGMRVINTERENAIVTIAGIQFDGRYVLRFETGPLAGQLGENWNRAALARMDGCLADLCVGMRAINTERENAVVTVVGIQQSGKYVIRFDSGALAGQLGSSWDRNSLARTEGCGANLCVGNRVYVRERNLALAQVVGIQTNGKYVITFLNGALAGLTGANWGIESLVYAR